MLGSSYNLISMVKQSKEALHLLSKILSIMAPIWPYLEPKLSGDQTGIALQLEKPWPSLNTSNLIAVLQLLSRQALMMPLIYKLMVFQFWQETLGNQWKRESLNWNNAKSKSWQSKGLTLQDSDLAPPESSINLPKIWAVWTVHQDLISTPKPANVSAFKTVSVSAQDLNGMVIPIVIVTVLSVNVRMGTSWMEKLASVNAYSKECVQKDKNGIQKNVNVNVKDSRLANYLWNGIHKVACVNVFL